MSKTKKERAALELTPARTNYFQMIFENNVLGMGLLSLELEFVLVNHAICHLFGYSKTEFTQLSIQDVTHPNDSKLSTDRFKQLIQGRFPFFSIRKKYLKKDASSFIGKESVTTIRNANGQIQYLVLTIEDASNLVRGHHKINENERQLQLLFKNSPLGMAIVNADLRYEQVNHAMCQLFGYSRTEFLGFTVQEVTRPIDFEVCIAGVERLIRKEIEVFKMEKKYHKKDGTSFTVNLMVSSFYDEQENNLKFITTLEDITEKKKHEAALKREQERSKILIENSTDIITLMDKHTTILYESPSIERILGYTPEELIGTKALDLIHPKDLPKIASIITNKTSNVDGQIVEYRLQAKDGTWRYMQSTGTNLLRNPAIQAIVFHTRDVTQQRKAEKALRDSGELFRNLFEHSPIGVVMSSPHMRVLEVNAQFCKMLGYEKSELIDKTIDKISHPDDMEREMVYGYKILTGELDNFSIEKRYFRKDGSIMWGNLSISVIRNNKQEIQHIIAMVEDITTRKEAAMALEQYKNELEVKVKQRTAELKRSNEELSQFAYAASHDMKQPLRTISSFANLLKRRYRNKLDESAQEYIQFIVDGTKNMSQLISDLLEYAQYSSDKESHFETRNLNHIVEVVVRQLSKQISEHQVKITYCRLPSKMPMIVPKMIQLFQNLISNAIKFRRKDVTCEIHITAEDKADYWQIAVADNGIGIAKKHQEVIFQIFTKLHTAAQYSGSGIGLATCKKIVEQHHGKIWVSSEEGQGTTFFFTVKKGIAG